jgi:signal transduction histidine kinase
MPIVTADMDAASMIEDAASEVRAAYPASVVTVHTSGDTRGCWDRERLTQALINVMSNAVHHGRAGSPIEVEADGSGQDVLISVQNQGPAIGPDQIARMFDGMKELGAPRPDGDRRHLGLGLYIVDKIVAAHGGTVTVQSSSEHGTRFSVCLPRRVP